MRRSGRRGLSSWKSARAAHSQGIECSAADSEGVRSSFPIEPQPFGNSRCDRIRSLGCMIESRRPDRRYIAQSALHLVGYRQRGEKVAPRAVRVLARSQHRAEIIARMTSLPLRQITVVEIQVSNQGAVEECGAIGSAPPPTDQSASPLGAKFMRVIA